ncbi:MAG: peptidase M22 [Acutalibacteraceae bacterium]
MSGFLGFDTSNYTTSVAIFDNGSVIQEKRLLPVKEGERGIRQSDAVFHHTKAYSELFEKLLSRFSGEISAVGASVTPTTQEGSYMPCFLVGENAAKAVATALNVPFYRFSHQQGHIAAALYSSGRTDLIYNRFLAFHVSGGTTDLVLCEPDESEILKITPISCSMDLKAGQAVDRIGVKMGIPFPAGAGLEVLAQKSEKNFKNKIKLQDGNCSLSGLENKCLKMFSQGESKEDIAKFLLTYIADTVSAMTEYALQKYGDLPVVFAGGVMSDKIIKDIITSRFDAAFAQPEYSCDNAAGIAYLTSLK